MKTKKASENHDPKISGRWRPRRSMSALSIVSGASGVGGSPGVRTPSSCRSLTDMLDGVGLIWDWVCLKLAKRNKSLNKGRDEEWCSGTAVASR